MIKLRITRILDYYDVPQLFVAEDVIGTRYLCLLYDIESDGELKVIGVAVSSPKLNDFVKGHIDLLTMFTSPEMEGAIFQVQMKEEGIFAVQYSGHLDDSMLPDEGYFFDDSLNENEEMIARASKKNKPIIRLAFQTPQNNHDMDARCLSAALVHFQSLVDNSYKKLYKEEYNNSTLRVTTFLAASFDVEFVADESLDMFGQSKLGQTFDVIKNLFSTMPEDVVATLRELKGFAANSYKNFLEVLIDNDLSINLKWVFSTIDSEVHQSKVEKVELRKLHDIVTNNSELGSEEIIFEGIFTSANNNGKWSFQRFDGIIIKGDSADTSLMSGVTIIEKKYKIVCDAKTFLNETTLKEKIKYTLIRFDNPLAE